MQVASVNFIPRHMKMYQRFIVSVKNVKIFWLEGTPYPYLIARRL